MVEPVKRSERTRSKLDLLACRYKVHPFLLVMLPILNLQQDNNTFVLVEHVYTPILIAWLLIGCIFWLSYLSLKDSDKAAIVASTISLWFYSYANFIASVNYLLGMVHQQPVVALDYNVAAVYCCFWVVALFLILRFIPNRPVDFTSALNITSLSLVVYTVTMICVCQHLLNGFYQPIRAYEREEDKTLAAPMIAPKNAPDIYYIIMDGCARSDTLKEVMGFDNSAFQKYLRFRGFFIADQSCSNYALTVVSLNSSLNMELLDYAISKLNVGIPLYVVGERMIEENRVMRLMHKAGYKVINVASGYGPTQHIPEADFNVHESWGTWFNLVLMSTTVLYPFEPELNLLIDAHRTSRLNFFENAKHLVRIPGPKFVFAHVVMPHPPFTFDRDGNLPDLKYCITQPWYKDYYVDQLRYEYKRVIDVVDLLLRDKKKRPIIIIQSDHGASTTITNDEKPTLLNLKERMRNFNAIYLPTPGPTPFYDTETPVNTFRIIFNKYFGCKFPLLPDRSNYSPYGHPYKMTDVTEQIKGRGYGH